MARQSSLQRTIEHRPVTPDVRATPQVDQLASPPEPTLGRSDIEAAQTARQASPAELFSAGLHERISCRAYEIAERGGFLPGDEVGDWLRAEREVLAAPDVHYAFEDQHSER